MNKFLLCILFLLDCSEYKTTEPKEETKLGTNKSESGCTYNYFMNGDKIDSTLVECPNVFPPSPPSFNLYR